MARSYLPSTSKLTKKYFMSLPAGRFIVANLCDHPYRSGFAEEVAPRWVREEQWNRIKSAGAQGRLCGLFQDWTSFRRHARRKQASARRHGYEY